MRAFAAFIVPAAALGVIAACASNPSTTQPTAPTATYGAYPPGYGPPMAPSNPGGYPPAGYPPGTYPPGYATAPPQPDPAPTYAPAPAPTYAPQPVYTAQPTPTYAPPAPAPAPAPPPAPAPGPAASGQMATPGLLALPCQSDAICGWYHCNVQAGKCASPCQSAVDCVAPNQCVMGACLPVGGF
jgi:hypothetical protein